MKIQEQIIEWFNCCETTEEKIEVLRSLSEIQEDLLTELKKLKWK